jgi:hypothetical protein
LLVVSEVVEGRGRRVTNTLDSLSPPVLDPPSPTILAPVGESQTDHRWLRASGGIGHHH